MKIKICGINSFENAQIALSAGADAIGFLVGTTHLAEDKISNDEAKKIISLLPPFISSVAVTHLTDINEICEMVKYLETTTLQLHADMSVQSVKKIKSLLPSVKIIKTVHVINNKAIILAKNFEPYVDAILLDSRTANRLGGTGETHDWNISQEIVKHVHKPVILAGGLKPQNVNEAVKKVNPYAVDVNSGIEVDGNKDYKKIKEFIYNAKNL